MKRSQLLFLILAICLNGTITAQSVGSSKADKFRRSANAIPNRYIVLLNEAQPNFFGETINVETESANLARTYGGTTDKIFAAALKGYSVEMAESEALALSNDPLVKYVVEDVMMSVASTQTTAPWGLDRLDQQSLPLQGDYNYYSSGTGVNAYVIDTGIRRTHTDFGGRVQTGYDAVGDGQNGNDCHGHGTHVAGTIGSSTYGVAKNVTLYPVRVLQCDGYGSASAIIAGIDWVTTNHISPAVANVSLSANAPFQPLNDAITASVASGVTFVVAASNNGADACNYSPASTPDAITVGATGSTDQRASFSNFGPCVDLFAPGVVITSTTISSDTSSGILSGTSMASPHVAGVAALYLETHPTASPLAVTNAIKNGATQSVVTSAGTGSPNLLLFSLIDGNSQTITGISPNSGIATVGTAKTIAWTNVGGFTSNVTIELSKDGGVTFPTTIASNVPNTGSFNWTVPAEVTSTARLRVREFDAAAPAGASSGNFVISFAPTASSVRVSGRVSDENGRGIARALVTIRNAEGQITTVRTGSFGYFVFDSVQAGESYVVTPVHKQYQFAPMIINVLDELAEVDFIGTE